MGDVVRSETSSDPRADSLEIVLEAVPLSVSTARHAVAELLGRVAVVPSEVIEDVLLLVSELVTNVVLHAGTAVRVTACAGDGRIFVAVGDEDPHNLPLWSDRGLFAPSGRGMRLVDMLASSWGVDVGEGRKVVWFESPFEPALLDLRSR